MYESVIGSKMLGSVEGKLPCIEKLWCVSFFFLIDGNVRYVANMDVAWK